MVRGTHLQPSDHHNVPGLHRRHLLVVISVGNENLTQLLIAASIHVVHPLALQYKHVNTSPLIHQSNHHHQEVLILR